MVCFTVSVCWRDSWSVTRSALLIPQNVLKPFIAIRYDRPQAIAASCLSKGARCLNVCYTLKLLDTHIQLDTALHIPQDNPLSSEL